MDLHIALNLAKTLSFYFLFLPTLAVFEALHLKEFADILNIHPSFSVFFYLRLSLIFLLFGLNCI
jgi:hypothetical protein